MLWQPDLPEKYTAMPAEEAAARIAARKAELGESLLLLVHHYQRDEVVRHADFVGDSLKLSQLSARETARRDAKWIVFCGVHFMAETADILNDGRVPVILPDLSAGCSMADMAHAQDALDALEAIATAHEKAGDGVRVVPITYVNSSAAVKAIVGRMGGACCTSSNAAKVFEWALAGGDTPLGSGERVQIVFLPDQHLGRNTAKRAGFVTEVDAARTGARAQMALWSPKLDSGGLTREEILDLPILLWAGHCSVHKLFRPEHVEAARASKAGARVVVHPECAQEVVDLADEVGSTEFIVRTLEAAEPGSTWFVGTEFNLVARLGRAAAARGVTVRVLSECQCLCTTMYRISPAHLLWVLDGLAEGMVRNQVSVHPEARAEARRAIDRMMANATQPLVAVD